jgi:hypothetical protein
MLRKLAILLPALTLVGCVSFSSDVDQGRVHLVPDTVTTDGIHIEQRALVDGGERGAVWTFVSECRAHHGTIRTGFPESASDPMLDNLVIGGDTQADKLFTELCTGGVAIADMRERTWATSSCESNGHPVTCYVK